MPGLIVPPELTFVMQPMQPFGFGVGCLSVRHGDGSCNCVVSPAGAVLSQGLEELDFLRGACSAAQVRMLVGQREVGVEGAGAWGCGVRNQSCWLNAVTRP